MGVVTALLRHVPLDAAVGSTSPSIVLPVPPTDQREAGTNVNECPSGSGSQEHPPVGLLLEPV